MEFLLTVRSSKTDEQDVAVEVDPEQKIMDLAIAISDHCNIPVRQLVIPRTLEILNFDCFIRDAQLLSGDILEVNLPAPSIPPEVLQSRTLDFVVGPEEGKYYALPPGSKYIVGSDMRSGDVAIKVNDASIAQRHFKIIVAESLEATIEPIDGTVLVNGVHIDGLTILEPEDFVEAGNLGFAVREYTKIEDRIDRLGQVEFHRTPYRQQIVRERNFEPLTPIPSTAGTNRFQYLALLAPIVLGLTMFLAQGRQPAYLLFILMSPMMMAANYVDDKRRGRKNRTQERAEFVLRLEQRVAELRVAVEVERKERWSAAPDTPSLLRRVEYRTANLWPRGRDSQDFLHVRVGLSDLPSKILSPLDPGGDDDLRAQAVAEMAFAGVIRNVPYVLSFAELGAVAFVGERNSARSAAASVIMQVAVLHSPEDLVITVGSQNSGDQNVDIEFDLVKTTKWLPHTYSLSSPLEGSHVCEEKEEFNRLLGSIIAEADNRLTQDSTSRRKRWPWMVVVIEETIDANPNQVAQLLERCPAAGMTVIWLSESRNDVPRQVTTIVDVALDVLSDDSVAWSTNPTIPDQRIQIGVVSEQIFDKFVRAIAPLRDASEAQAAASIPRTAPLLEVLGVKEATADWVIEQWTTEKGYSLKHPIGLDVSGPFVVDLVEHGPHALIGGTSGSGKSELLQSIAASLISMYPPKRLNLLFVDYKGGAASKPFENIPHTVGYVTNLDEQLALRTIVSLKAELRWRMELFSKFGGCKDLREMIDRHPDQAPASLVIVVDEFATLVKEIPDFVAGVVDIAQRGRSLGIHLILATQRPSGAVSENILANTNLRVSLRMLDAGESTAVINAPAAADIPTPLRGRGFARLGPRELIAFQAAHSSSPMSEDEVKSTVMVMDFDRGWKAEILQANSSGEVTNRRTQLESVIEAVTAAAQKLQIPRPRAPWKSELPDIVELHEVLSERPRTDDASFLGRDLCLGLVDDPERQDQYPGIVDVEASGGLLVFGSGGSGKTTLLRSLISSIASESSTEEVEIAVFDFGAKSLQSVERFPHISGYANGDDLESVTRLISNLEVEIEKRRQVLAGSMSETLTSHIGLKGNKMSRILVVMDEYHNFVLSLNSLGLASQNERWVERFARILIDGRSVGVHTVLTADRRASVPTIIHSSVSARIVLRQSDEMSFSDFGIPGIRSRFTDMPAGRGFWIDNKRIQIACVSKATDTASQALKICDLIDQCDPSKRLRPWSQKLPNFLSFDRRHVPDNPTHLYLGEEDIFNQPVVINFERSNVLISGPPLSGRSNALLVIGSQLHKRTKVFTFGHADSPLRFLENVDGAFGKIKDVEEGLRKMINSNIDKEVCVLIDDLDVFREPEGRDLWESVVASENLKIVATIESQNLTSHSYNDLVREMKKSRIKLLLQPENIGELSQVVQVRLTDRPGLDFSPGRGFLVTNRKFVTVQTPWSPLSVDSVRREV